MSCRAIYPRTFTQENVLLIDETITSDRGKNKFNTKKNYTLMTIRYALQKTTILFFSFNFAARLNTTARLHVDT